MFPDKQAYKSDHITLDRETYEYDLKNFSRIFLELPKFEKGIDELTTLIEKWLCFFKYADETSQWDVAKIVGSDEIVERVYEELNRFSWNEEEPRGYDQIEKYDDAYQSTLAVQYHEGKREGIKEATQRSLKLNVNKNAIIETLGLLLSND